MNPEILTDDINSLADQQTALLDKLDRIREEREKANNFVVTEAAVKELLNAIREMLAVAEPSQLKTALRRFIDRIEVSGDKISISYNFTHVKTELVILNGDLCGIRTRDLLRDREIC